MISHISGKIIDKYNQALVVMTNAGIGYEVLVSPTLFLEQDEEVSLYTYLAVRESAMELYGFRNLAERDLFIKFLDVSGVGPKSALHLLSLGTVEEISGAISRGDVGYLTKVSGVGKKTAERIVVELKSKIADSMDIREEESGEQLGDVVDGLVSMGYSKEEARSVARGLEAGEKSSEQLLREALKSLAK